jgi:hypothetical protein
MTRELTSLYSLGVQELRMYDTYELFMILAAPSAPRAPCTIKIFTYLKSFVEFHAYEDEVNESEGNESDVEPP